jgi:protein N-terminal methyltransferase
MDHQIESNEIISRKITETLAKSATTSNGLSTNGNEYHSLNEMWSTELSILKEDNASKESTNKEGAELWYEKGAEYWNSDSIPATVNGVLGGYGHISTEDVTGSKVFLNKIHQMRPFEWETSVDCGAGIGRVALNLLDPLFASVDIVEQSPRLIEKARNVIKSGEFYCTGLQNWVPETEKYDVIWIQWVLGHLTDADLISLLKRCKRALKSNGVIVIKENAVSSKAFLVDNEDSSVTRAVSYFLSIFNEADLKVIGEPYKQERFPTELFPVYMYALY